MCLPNSCTQKYVLAFLFFSPQSLAVSSLPSLVLLGLVAFPFPPAVPGAGCPLPPWVSRGTSSLSAAAQTGFVQGLNLVPWV